MDISKAINILADRPSVFSFNNDSGFSRRNSEIEKTAEIFGGTLAGLSHTLAG